MKSQLAFTPWVGMAFFASTIGFVAPGLAESPASSPAASAPASAPNVASADADLPRIQEVWSSFGSKYNNTDSLAAATLPTGAVWLFATSKGGHWIDAYDAGTGAFMKRFGKEGDGPGEFRRPNGIATANITIDSRGTTRPALIVVERDNRRVQAIWADTLTPAGILVEKLDKPYGCAIAKRDNDLLLYVTDEKAQPRERVRLYKLMRDGDVLKAEFIRGIGQAEGPGVIEKPESIAVDGFRERLLICDEARDQKNVKVYSLTGSFSGVTFGGGKVVGEPEGLVVWRTPDFQDVVILTDQRPEITVWHIFEAEDYKHLLSCTGTQKIANSDGIAIFPESIGDYQTGLMFAVHDDADIRGYNLATLAAKLKKGK